MHEFLSMWYGGGAAASNVHRVCCVRSVYLITCRVEEVCKMNHDRMDMNEYISNTSFINYTLPFFCASKLRQWAANGEQIRQDVSEMKEEKTN